MDETHLDIFKAFLLHYNLEQDLCRPQPAAEVVLLCFRHTNRSIELKVVHSLDYHLGLRHFPSLGIAKWFIIFLEVTKVRHYENLLKLFKRFGDAIELVCAVINKHRVARKVDCKHKPVPISPNKGVIIFSVHKYHDFGSKELVVLSYDIVQIGFCQRAPSTDQTSHRFVVRHKHVEVVRS